MLYTFLRPLLFQLDPERAHDLTLKSLAWLQQHGLACLFAPPPVQPKQLMGLTFPNPVGLAAGLDKNGEYIDALAALGFGFLEIGTVTPKPQAGNAQPRLFRLPAAKALINRMGFNNQGLDFLLARVKQRHSHTVLGINIGKNASTPLKHADEDYVTGLQAVYAYADYVAVNISSPNTAGLRQLQQGDALDRLLDRLKQTQQQLATTHGRYVPLVVKIAPDLAPEQVALIAEQLLNYQLDGVIATNTTLSRTAVTGLPHGDESGGLSGAPLTEPSTQIVAQLAQLLDHRLPIIAAGGIMSAADAQAKIAAGASLVQIYSGLIYRGPRLIREIARAI